MVVKLSQSDIFLYGFSNCEVSGKCLIKKFTCDGKSAVLKKSVHIMNREVAISGGDIVQYYAI